MKSFKILLLAIGWSIAIISAFAQTWTQTSAPYNNWTAIASSADGNKLVAVGLDGVFTSTDSGANWTSNNIPKNSWSCVASSADGCKLAAAAARRPITPGPFYTSTNSGATWVSNSMPDNQWLSIAMSADGSKLAAVSPNRVFTSVDSGITWWSTNLIFLESVVSSADGTKLVAAGLEICLSTNSGNSWIQTNYLGVTSIACSADGTRLVAGGRSIFISTNSGITWMQTSAPATNWISVASSADGSRLVAVAGGSRLIQNPVFNGPIYTSTNSGVTWISNNVPVQYWNSVASSADGGKLAAVVHGGGIWVWQATPAPEMNITPTNGNLTLSWVVPSTNFVMQQSSNLSDWTDMMDAPVLNLTNLENEVVLLPTNDSGFYRLKTP